MEHSLEQLLAFHCGPALAGIKPGNLVACKKAQHPCFHKEVAQYNRLLNGKDIYFKIVCQCDKKFLLLVYRKSRLATFLAGEKQKELLQKAGYPVEQGLEGILLYLRERLTGHKDFPHEIGLFLGYPPEDVVGFWENKGQNFRLSGYWKVYGDPHTARALFDRYDRCRAALCRRVAQGVPLTQLFCAA